jgi:hypothetical protein
MYIPHPSNPPSTHIYIYMYVHLKQDYDTNSVAYRPSHADATYDAKYGLRAIAGGGALLPRDSHHVMPCHAIVIYHVVAAMEEMCVWAGAPVLHCIPCLLLSPS